MNKRQALTRALFGIIVLDFIKISMPPKQRASDEFKLYIIGLSLSITILIGGLYIASKIKQPTIIFWGIIIGIFFAYWFTYASEIIKDKYQSLNDIKQIENIVRG